MKPAETDGETAPDRYTIRVRGCLSSRWDGWFEGMAIKQQDGDTLLSGPVADQAALYGLLKQIRDLGMTLISVNKLPDAETRFDDSTKEQPHETE